MKKLSVFAGGAFVVASSSVALFGSGLAAAAPDVVGQPYSDAVAAIEEEGGTAFIAVTVGGSLPQDECIVTNAQTMSALRPAAIDEAYPQFYAADSEVMLTLNCAGGYATATNPGASLASPMGREAKAAADQAAAAEEQELAEVSTPDE